MALKNSGRERVYGFPTAIGTQFPEPHRSQIDPTIYDVGGAIGQLWVNEATEAAFILMGISGGEAVWANIAGGAGFFTSLLVEPGPIVFIGATFINDSGTAATRIGNATGNTVVTGTMTVSGTITTTNGSVIVGNTAASTAGSNVELRKSRAGGVITSGDTLGSVIFEGNDGTTNIAGAAITSTNSGTVATNRIAADLKFWTHPDSTAGLVHRGTFSPAGNLTIITPDSGVALTLSAATTAISVTGGDVTIGAGDLNINTPGQGINLPGPIQIITGAGDPAGALAINIGDLYINTVPTTTDNRLFIAIAPGAWTFFSAND